MRSRTGFGPIRLGGHHLSEDNQYPSRTVKRLPIEDRFDNNIFEKLLNIQSTLHPDEDTDISEEVDFEDPTNQTGEIDPDQMVITSLKNDVFDINSITKVYGSWDRYEEPVALHAPVLTNSTTAFPDEMLSAAMANNLLSLQYFKVFSEVKRESISSDREILDV